MADQNQSSSLKTPRSVVDAKRVDLVLVTYIDRDGAEQTQLAVAGDTTLLLLNGQPLGASTTGRTQSSGFAGEWLRDGVFKLLGREVKK